MADRGRAIVVKVHGEADFKEVQDRVDRVFGAARRRAQDAADGIERSLESSGEGAVRAARRASDAFAGVSRAVADGLRTAGEGVDFDELTSRANDALRRVDPELLVGRLASLPAEVRPAALGEAYDLALRQVSTAPLEAKLRNLVDVADAALAGRELGAGIQRGLDSVDLQGMIDFLENGFRRVDASPLTREIESALEAVRPELLTVELDNALERTNFGLIVPRLESVFNAASLSGFVTRADAELSGIDFESVTRNLREAFSTVGDSGVGDALNRAVREVDFSPLGDEARRARVEVLDALDIGAINANLAAMFGQGVDSGPVRDRVARLQDELRDLVSRLPPFFRTVGEESGQALGDGLDEALADLPSQFDRTNQRLAAEVRKLAETLPREALPAAAELANALDPRPFTARKFDGLQDQLARVARDLPDEFRPAALKIANVLEDSARKIPPPFGRAADQSAEAMDDIPRAARQAADDADDAFRRAADDIPRHFDGVEGRISQRLAGIRRSIGNVTQIALGNIGAELAGNLTSGVSQFVTEAPQKSIDLEAFRVRSQTVFGAASADIENYAKNAAGAIGLSERAALDATSAFGNQFVQLGIGREEAARMAKVQTNLIGDFATFAKISPEKATEALSAAYRGEYDSLQRVIPAITAKKIEDTALLNTGKKSAKQLTDQEKALAAYSVILGNVGPAQGAFKQGLDVGNPAAQMLLYNAQLEDVQTRLGTKMIPLQLKFKQAQLAVATFLVDRALPVLSRYSGVLNDTFGPALGAAKDKAGEFFTGLSKGFVAGDVSGFQGAGVQIRSFFEALFTGRTQKDDPAGVERIALGIRSFVDFLEAQAPRVEEVLGRVGSGVAGVFQSETVQSAWEELGAAWESLMGTLGDEDTQRLLSGVQGALAAFFGDEGLQSGAGSAAAESVGLLIDVLRLLLTTAQETLETGSAIWDDYGAQITQFAAVGAGSIGTFLGLVAGIARVVRDMVDLVSALMRGDWAGAWSAAQALVTDTLSVVVDTVLALPRTIIDVARNMWAPLYNELVPVVNSIIGAVNSMITGLNVLPGVDIGKVAALTKVPQGAGKGVVRPLKAAATGDVAYRQQVRLIGDNYRAASDPEIVSPRSAIAAAVAMALEDAQFGQQGPQRVFNIDKVVTPPGRDLWQEIGLMERVLAQV